MARERKRYLSCTRESRDRRINTSTEVIACKMAKRRAQHSPRPTISAKDSDCTRSNGYPRHKYTCPSHSQGHHHPSLVLFLPCSNRLAITILSHALPARNSAGSALRLETEGMSRDQPNHHRSTPLSIQHQELEILKELQHDWMARSIGER
jgi:hypothetical protein